ncbi:MAG: CsgE family curli-type amyloid fiber assembly protein [Bacteroidota bacterium]
MLITYTTILGTPADTTSHSIYTVQPGDFLVKIASTYGNPGYWEAIYKANENRIKDPDLIFIGQQLVIPDSIAGDPERKATTKSENISDEENNESPTLAEFRKALSRVIRTKEEEEPYPLPQQYSGLEINGLIINETRSKIGDQFFNVFYQHWQAPDKAPDFMLTIEEKPMPSMGTLVTVLIDNTAIFQTKLQPRYQVIEQQALRAVTISYQTLEQRMETANQINFY